MVARWWHQLLVDFDWDNEHVSFAEILEVVGELPIPPYLNRKTEESDKTTLSDCIFQDQG